jgi:SNF2 family DNA or RNA helicase
MYVGPGSYCAICGKRLTNPISVHVGVGPICCGRYGIPRPESLTDEELQAQLIYRSTFKDLWLPKSQIEVLEGDLTPTEGQYQKQKEERWLKDIGGKDPSLRLKVSFEERQEAKGIFGCRGWDGQRKAWKFINDPFVVAQITSIWPEFAQNDQSQTGVGIPQLDGRLYQFQREGVERMSTLSGALLGDDMGLGKTPQLIQTAKALNARKVLVVCLATIKWHWQNEIKKWWPDATVQVVDGDAEQRLTQIKSGADFTIANYESFFHRVEADEKLKKKTGQKWKQVMLPGLDKMEWDILVLDEAHKIKNRKSKKTQTVKALRRQVDRVYLATGTPILNSAQELWSLLNVLFPKVFTSFWKFVEEFCNVTHNGYGYEIEDITDIDDPRIQKLRKLLEPVLIRRTKSEVFCDMPEKIVTKYPISLEGDQAKKYVEMEEKMLTEIGDEIVFAPIAMAQIVRLKQICIDPTLMIEDCQEPLSGPKVDAALDIIDSLGGRKAVVFTQWTRVANRFAKTLTEYGISCDLITGGVKGSERQNIIDTFQDDGDAQVLVCTIEAGGVGINLTAASTAIFFDELWTPKLNEQAEDRLHRHGQDETVNIIKLRAKDTVEEVIEGVLKRKAKISDIVIEKS